MEMESLRHPFPAIYAPDSRILILGSFPSVKSREQMFFYGHPQNRFWRVMAALLGADVPQTVEEKRAFLLANHIALWDVIASCDIAGSSDASIRNAVPNDLTPILETASIRQIFTNGGTAHRLYRKYIYPLIGGGHRPSLHEPRKRRALTQMRLSMRGARARALKEE